MMKLTAALAASILALGVSVSTHAATANDGNGADASTTQTQKAAPKQPGASATTAQNAENAQTNTAQAPIAHTWDDQNEETAKMPGTTGPRNTPKGGAGLSYPSTQ